MDDDDHFCNKCRKTVTGLDNYVRHRCGCCFSIFDILFPRYIVKHRNRLNPFYFIRKSGECHKQDDLIPLPASDDQEEVVASGSGTEASKTAAGALANEAAFMENIGLYLNPRPLLNLPMPAKADVITGTYLASH